MALPHNGELEQQTYRREELKPYVGTRITVEGRIHRWGSYYDTDLKRTVPTVLMKDLDIMEGPDLDKRFGLITYCWVQFSQNIEDSGAKLGDVVRMTCVVFRYHSRDRDDPNKTHVKYTLRDPVSVQVVRPLVQERVVVLPLPPIQAAPVVTLPVVQASAPAEPQKEPQKDPPPKVEPRPESPRSDSRECFDVIMDAVQTFGLQKVKKALKAVELLQSED